MNSSRLRRELHEACGQSLFEFAVIEIAADKNDSIKARSIAPGQAFPAIDELVHALEHHSDGRSLDRQDAFNPEDVASLQCEQIAEPAVKRSSTNLAHKL